MEKDEVARAIEELDSGSVRFSRLVSICRKHFGEPRTKGSHHIFSMPWPGDPRINLQEDKGGMAKAYQVKQVMAALTRLAGMD